MRSRSTWPAAGSGPPGGGPAEPPLPLRRFPAAESPRGSASGSGGARRSRPRTTPTAPRTLSVRRGADAVDREVGGDQQFYELHEVSGRGHPQDRAATRMDHHARLECATKKRPEGPIHAHLEHRDARSLWKVHQASPAPCGSGRPAPGTRRISTMSRFSERSRARNPWSSAWSRNCPVRTVRTSCDDTFTPQSRSSDSSETRPFTRTSKIWSPAEDSVDFSRPPQARSWAWSSMVGRPRARLGCGAVDPSDPLGPFAGLIPP